MFFRIRVILIGLGLSLALVSCVQAPPPVATTTAVAASSPTVQEAAAPPPAGTAVPSTPAPAAAPTDTPLPSPAVSEAPVDPVDPAGASYENSDLGVTWQAHDPEWIFIDATILEGVFSPLIPLVGYSPAAIDAEEYLTLFTIDMPPMVSQATAMLFETDPDLAVKSLSAGLGLIGVEPSLVELSAKKAALVSVDGPEGELVFMWLVPQPTGILYILAEGFAEPADAQAALAGLALSDVAVEVAEPISLEDQMKQLIHQTESIRGLDTIEAVDFEFMNRDDLRAELEESLAADLQPESLAALDQMLKLLQLIPNDTNLNDLMLDLYESQILGFYDDEEDAFFLIADEERQGQPLSVEDQITFVHEYTHALQDQHFDLSLFVGDEAGLAEDEQGAVDALVEGEATLVMLHWMIENPSLEMLGTLASAAAAELNNAVLQNTPRYLQEALLFPYEAGLQFVDTVFATGGWQAVDALWDDLPASTEQILHPEKYRLDQPTEVSLPADLAEAMGSGWQEILRDVWGEIDLRLLLGDLDSDQASSGADGWDGSEYVFLTDDAGNGLFAIEIAWDSPDEAAEGTSILAEWLAATGYSTGEESRFTAGDRVAFLRQAGDRSTLAIADEEKALTAVLTALGWAD
ncbi:MAG: hypothetical protein U9R25_08735 [Chloroflexota bacterium]|nr:hypothetical protein [Chloroflexota bacterium]